MPTRWQSSGLIYHIIHGINIPDTAFVAEAELVNKSQPLSKFERRLSSSETVSSASSLPEPVSFVLTINLHRSQFQAISAAAFLSKPN